MREAMEAAAVPCRHGNYQNRCPACTQESMLKQAARAQGMDKVQRDWLTFAEAMEALKAGKKVRADERQDIWFQFDVIGDLRAYRHGDSSVEIISIASAGISRAMFDWHFHIVVDKPAKSRVREMAEAEVERCMYNHPDEAKNRHEEFARDVVEAVANSITNQWGEPIVSFIRREFLEPRKR